MCGLNYTLCCKKIHVQQLFEVFITQPYTYITDKRHDASITLQKQQTKACTGTLFWSFFFRSLPLVMSHVTGRRWKTQSVVCVRREEGVQQVSLLLVT